MEKAYVQTLLPRYIGSEEFEEKEAYVKNKINKIDFEKINKLGREWAESIIEDKYFARPGNRNDSGVDFVCAIQMASYPGVYEDGIEKEFLDLWNERKNPSSSDYGALIDVIDRCKDYAESWGFRPYFDQDSIVNVRKDERGNGDTVYWCRAHFYKNADHVTRSITVPNPKGLYDACKGNIGNYPDRNDIDMAYFDHDLGMIDVGMAKEAMLEIMQEN